MVRQRLRAAALGLLIVGTATLGYYVLGRVLYEGMWGDSDRGTQPNLTTVLVLTRPAEGRIAASAQRVRNAARRAGFRPSPFEVRQTVSAYRLSWLARRQSHIAGYLWDLGIVIADTTPMTALSDSEMDCVLAHEVGHILQHDEDYPATLEGPIGHQRLMIEMDADLRAAAICGEDNWNRFFSDRIGVRMMVQP